MSKHEALTFALDVMYDFLDSEDYGVWKEHNNIPDGKYPDAIFILESMKEQETPKNRILTEIANKIGSGELITVNIKPFEHEG